MGTLKQIIGWWRIWWAGRGNRAICYQCLRAYEDCDCEVSTYTERRS